MADLATGLHTGISLWAPLLSHYAAGAGGVRLDLDRTAAHAAAIRGHVRGFLLAGSTGDGWDMDDESFDDVLRLAERPDAFDPSCALVFGALRADTASVIARARRVESWAAEGRAAGTVIGHTVCPPVDKGADQAAIIAHYESVLAETSLPIAVYQLPQVTGCEIGPEAMHRLADTGRVILFKDTSGLDTVGKLGFSDPRVRMLRGAEGLYAESLKPGGVYDGWLLASANAFAPWLAEIYRSQTGVSSRIDAVFEGMVRAVASLSWFHKRGLTAPLRANAQKNQASVFSARVAAAVNSVFQAADGLSFANPFSNANRAADHIMAYGAGQGAGQGAGWRAAPAPAAFTGDVLPVKLLEAAETALASLGPIPAAGYMNGNPP